MVERDVVWVLDGRSTVVMEWAAVWESSPQKQKGRESAGIIGILEGKR